MKTIYFVRHAESEATANNIAAGGEFEAPLTDYGRKQAKKTGKGLKDKKIDVIVSSPMIRAIETAKIIAQEIGYNPNKIMTNPVFVERKLGIYSGRPLAEFKQDFDKDALHESVESVESLSKRVKDGLKWLSELNAERVVLISHGDVSRALRLIHQDLPHSHLYKLERHDNAEVYKFTIE
jgi:uncharacterized phosphatase